MPGGSRIIHRVRATISGRVQGVFFRASTVREAVALGLIGSATNLADGRVEVIAQGPTDELKVLMDWLHCGPELARVEAVHIEDLEPVLNAANTFTAH